MTSEQYCNKCNAPHKPPEAVLMRCGTCAVVNGKLPPTKYQPIEAAHAKGAGMTKEEIDILWHKAMRLSIEDGDQFTRYRFAELVAEAERNRTWTQDHWTEYERSIAAAAKAEEREACAKVCEDNEVCIHLKGGKSLHPRFKDNKSGCDGDVYAAAIRARGNS